MKRYAQGGRNLERKFKKGDLIRRGGYSCRYVVIGYKYDNHLLALNEGEEDKFTNRELLYDKWPYLD